MSRRSHWSFSETDVFPARITGVGSEGDDAGIPHGWQQLVIRSLDGTYEDDLVGMTGTVDFNSAYRLDGSAARVGDIVYVRVRGMSSHRGVIFDILDPMVGLVGVSRSSSGSSSGGSSGGGTGGGILPGSSGSSGGGFTDDPEGGIVTIGFESPGSLASTGGGFGSAGSPSVSGEVKPKGDCGCGCGGSGKCGGGCGCGGGVGGGCGCSGSHGDGEHGSSGFLSTGIGGSFSPSSLESSGVLFSSGADVSFDLAGSLSLGTRSRYGLLFEKPFEFVGDLDAFLEVDAGAVASGWWSLGAVYDYLESTPLNNYAPGSARFLLLESDGAGVKTITGLSMGQVDSQEVWIKNIGTVDNIILSWEDTGSLAPNRFNNSPSVGSDVLVPGASALYKYSASLSRWVKMR